MLFEPADHADVREPAGATASERDADARPLWPGSLRIFCGLYAGVQGEKSCEDGRDETGRAKDHRSNLHGGKYPGKRREGTDRSSLSRQGDVMTMR
jgi:hypothetical protein